MAVGGYVRASDLPQVIPVFPLDGALLLPQGMLPLNIFEPRYLNMVDDVMAGDRLIGMVQTREGADRERPPLQDIGCAGRITSFAETADGRYLISLTGVCRFRLGRELPVQTPYRQVCAEFDPFAHDLATDGPEATGLRPAVLEAFKLYLTRRGLEVDWKTAGDAPVEALVNSLSMALPFMQAEKQALLEAHDVVARAAALVALLRMGAAGSDDDDDTPQAMQ